MTPRPVAVRAAAFTVPSRWSERPVRRVRYDALWPDGHVEFDVSLVDTMYRGAPADYSPVARAVDDRCPEVGAGPWIDESASEVEGPGVPPGRPGDPREGARRVFHPATDQPRRAHATLWRALVGLVLVTVGMSSLTTTGVEGFVAFLWFLPTVSGLALLGGLLRRRRPW